MSTGTANPAAVEAEAWRVGNITVDFIKAIGKIARIEGGPVSLIAVLQVLKGL